MEILGVGYQELFLVFALIIIVVGPKRLPEMAYHLGRAVKTLQGYARVVRDEFGEEFGYLNEEMKALKSDVGEVQGSIREVQDDLKAVQGEVVQAGSEARDATAPVAEEIKELKAIPAQTGSNGAAAPKGVPGPGYLGQVSANSGQEPASPPEPEPEPEAKPAEKPLLF